MNKTKLKNYAVNARRDFINAIRNRAYIFGLGEGVKPEIQTVSGGIILNGKTYEKKIGDQIEKLQKKIDKCGFERTIEEIAYTWFNRFVALRFMELQNPNFLPHGRRVLSNSDGTNTPEILQSIFDVELP